MQFDKQLVDSDFESLAFYNWHGICMSFYCNENQDAKTVIELFQFKNLPLQKELKNFTMNVIKLISQSNLDVVKSDEEWLKYEVIKNATRKLSHEIKAHTRFNKLKELMKVCNKSICSNANAFKSLKMLWKHDKAGSLVHVWNLLSAWLFAQMSSNSVILCEMNISFLMEIQNETIMEDVVNVFNQFGICDYSLVLTNNSSPDTIILFTMRSEYSNAFLRYCFDFIICQYPNSSYKNNYHIKASSSDDGIRVDPGGPSGIMGSYFKRKLKLFI